MEVTADLREEGNDPCGEHILNMRASTCQASWLRLRASTKHRVTAVCVLGAPAGLGCKGIIIPLWPQLCGNVHDINFLEATNASYAPTLRLAHGSSMAASCELLGVTGLW